MATDKEWASAFAAQAASDLAAREVLIARADLPPCHELHFLQMACEKLSKAHLYYLGSPPPDIQSSHGHTAKQIPVVLREALRRVKAGNPWLLREIRNLSREIALLHPQVDGGGTRPDNCEYPWTDARGRVFTPAAHDFPELDLAKSQAGREFLKLLHIATDELVRKVE